MMGSSKGETEPETFKAKSPDEVFLNILRKLCENSLIYKTNMNEEEKPFLKLECFDMSHYK